jgi:hypothetical protein
MADLKQIVLAVVERFNDLTVANGYGHNWGTVQEFDATQKIYPDAEVTIVSGDAHSDDTIAHMGFSKVTCEIKISVENDNADDPKYLTWENEQELLTVFADVRKLFMADDGYLPIGVDESAVLRFIGFDRVKHPGHDAFVPGCMRIKTEILFQN